MTLCFTPGHLGLEDHHTSPPADIRDFAEFARWAVSRYASPGQTGAVNPTARSLYALPQMKQRAAEIAAFEREAEMNVEKEEVAAAR